MKRKCKIMMETALVRGLSLMGKVENPRMGDNNRRLGQHQDRLKTRDCVEWNEQS